MSERTRGRRGFMRLAAGGALALPALANGEVAAKAAGYPKRPARKKALFVYGGWEGHAPAACRDLFVPWMKKAGFDVVVADSHAPYADAALMATIDVVVQTWTMGTIAPAPLAGLLAAVKAGAGLAGWHGGLADAYRNEPEYRYMVGGDWVAHPGNQIEHAVDIVDRQDPVTAGLASFTVKTEQYFMHVNPNNKVLATTTFGGSHDPWIEGSTMPVVWKKVYGKGRVFYSSLGHDAALFEKVEPALTMMQRGILWASDSRYEPTPSLVVPKYPRR